MPEVGLQARLLGFVTKAILTFFKYYSKKNDYGLGIFFPILCFFFVKLDCFIFIDMNRG